MNISLTPIFTPELQEPKVYYSDSKKGFLRSDIHKNSIPEDAIEITYDYHQELLQACTSGKTIKVINGQVVATEPIIDVSVLYKAFESATQKHLDDFAKQKGYDNILSACTYATSTNTTRTQEGQKAVITRDALWDYYFDKLEMYSKPGATIPTVQEYIAELPILTW